MHTLIQQSLINQQKEIEDLKQMLSAIQGKVYTPKPIKTPIDLQDLHPRGKKRFEKQDVNERFSKNLHRHVATERIAEKIVKD
jgi:hypothetical protein